MSDCMMDVIYCDEDRQLYDELWKEAAQAFPTAKIEDASDCIHGGRFSIELTTGRKEYIKWAIRQGLAKMSLALGVMMLGNEPELKEILAEMKAEGKK